MNSQTPSPAAAQGAYLRLYFLTMAAFALLAALVLLPYSFIWLHASGDAAPERAIASQMAGNFTLFGSALSQDFIDYKLQLYAAAKPRIITIGSSRVMQFRGAWFRESFVNMGGVAGNLAELRTTVNALTAIARPAVVIMGLDFWWFMPQWEKDPAEIIAPTSGSYNYSLGSLRKPWEWLISGKISLADFLAPITGMFGRGFSSSRYGIMAQKTSDGFGPDGSWYYTAEITGQKPAFDYMFQDTLENVGKGSRAFFHARKDQTGPSEAHLDVLAEIWCHLKSRGIQVYAFIPPVASRVLDNMDKNMYPHLFRLKESLQARGIDVMDFTNPRVFSGDDCEFVDGFHGGEVIYARILRSLADRWPALLAYVNMERLDAVIRDWNGNALVPDARLTKLGETDFLGLGCQKKSAMEQR